MIDCLPGKTNYINLPKNFSRIKRQQVPNNIVKGASMPLPIMPAMLNSIWLLKYYNLYAPKLDGLWKYIAYQLRKDLFLGKKLMMHSKDSQKHPVDLHWPHQSPTHISPLKFFIPPNPLLDVPKQMKPSYFCRLPSSLSIAAPTRVLLISPFSLESDDDLQFKISSFAFSTSFRCNQPVNIIIY